MLDTEQRHIMSKTLRIISQNLRKSHDALSDIINTMPDNDIHVLLLQEVPFRVNGGLTTSNQWTTILPDNHLINERRTRTAILIRSNIATGSWEEIITRGGDVTGVRIRTAIGSIAIYDIYDDQETEGTGMVEAERLTEQAGDGEDDYVVWAGDFNAHHPAWETDENAHLHAAGRNKRRGEWLHDATVNLGMMMVLPKGIGTYLTARKRTTRPDNVFCSLELSESIITCDVREEWKPQITDHFPILLELGVMPETKERVPRKNWKETDWTAFRKTVREQLSKYDPPRECDTLDKYNMTNRILEEAFEEATRLHVPEAKETPKRKRWWNAELSTLKKKVM